MLINPLWIYDGEECLKIFALNVSQRYYDGQSFVLTDTELSKPGGEIHRIAREKIAMDTVEGAVNLRINSK